MKPCIAELSPESAASVLAILREDAQLPTDPSTSSDAAWLKLLQPLADQEKRLAQEWRKRFMAATSLQALHLSAREFAEQAPTQLRALARYAPDQAELAFRHGLTLLNTAPSDATALRVWCNGSASAPPLIGPVFQALQQPEHAAILTEWTRDLALNLHLRTALQDPEYTIKLFQTLPFLADAAHFRGYTAPRLTFGTTLKTLTGYLSTPACKASRERLEKHLLSQPHRTFGVDVVLALLSKNSTAALAHTLLDHQAELPQLSAAAREDITQMLTHPPRRRQRLPLTPEEQKALEPFLPGA